MNKKIKLIFLIIFSILAVLTTAFIIITYSGYKIDLKYMRLLKTGSIYVNTNPAKADIYIDGKKISQKTPIIVNHITPGMHNIKLEKKGYKTWETDIDVPPEVTTFLNYELIYQDIELNKSNELSNDSLFFSNNSKYIAYIKKEDSSYNVYIYNIVSQEEFKAYSTDKNISSIDWSPDDKKILVEADNKFLLLNLSIVKLPIIETIQSYKLTNLNNLIKDIGSVMWNQMDDTLLIDTTENNLYRVNITTDKIEELNIKDFYNKGIFIGDKIIYINKNNEAIEHNLSNNIVNEYKGYNGIKSITYIDGYIVFLDNQGMFTLFKGDLKSSPIRLTGNNIKLNKSKIVTFNDSEINIYDGRENILSNTLRYSQKIIDLDFYNNDYIVLILSSGIKLINVDGNNINELDIISNLTTIEKVVVVDSRINIVYKDGDKHMISHIDLK